MPVLTLENLEVIVDDELSLISYDANDLPVSLRARLESAGAQWSWQDDDAGLCWKQGDDEIRFPLSPEAMALMGNRTLAYFLALHPEGGIVDSAFCMLPTRLVATEALPLSTPVRKMMSC